MIKNFIIIFLALTVLTFVLYYIGVFENINLTGRDERNQHAEKRISTVRKEPALVVGSVYSSEDLPAAESVKGAMLAAEILKNQGKKIEYIINSDCHKYPEIAAAVQQLCTNYRVSAILGPGNSEILIPVRAITQFHALPLISAITVRPDKLPQLEHDNYVSFFPPLEKWVDALLAHMKANKIRRILIISPENGSYGELFSSVLERRGKDFLDDFKTYRMSYQRPLRSSHFINIMTNYDGYHQVDAIFFGGVPGDLPELIQLLQTHNFKLPVYLSDEITLHDVQQLKDLQFHLFLPEADIPIRNQEWLDLYVKRYNMQPSYPVILGAETMFALAEYAEKGNYTPDALVQAMEQKAKEFNKKITIKIVDFSADKL